MKSQNQRYMLLISAGITAFVLVLVGAIAASVSLPSSAADAASQSVALQTEQPPVQQTGASSEAYYKQQLEEARAQLEEANRRLSSAYAEAATPGPAADIRTGSARPDAQAQHAAGAGSADSPLITAEQAASIASAAAPHSALLSGPELVDFEGTLAYEIRFDQGAVYVSAVTGALLNNAAIVAAESPSAQNSSQARHADDDEEHGGGRYEHDEGEGHDD